MEEDIETLTHFKADSVLRNPEARLTSMIASSNAKFDSIKKFKEKKWNMNWNFRVHCDSNSVTVHVYAGWLDLLPNCEEGKQ